MRPVFPGAIFLPLAVLFEITTPVPPVSVIILARISLETLKRYDFYTEEVPIDINRPMPDEPGNGLNSHGVPTNMEWIFGYGSLIWRPGFKYSDSTLALLPGWRREFSQGSPDHRGTPQRPGRVVTLREDQHAHCEGVAYRVSPADVASIVEYLDERESGGYVRQYVEITLASNRKTHALTYIALPGNPHACEPTSVEQLIALITERRGPSGTNRDYVVNLARALNSYNIFDPAVEQLVERLL